MKIKGRGQSAVTASRSRRSGCQIHTTATGATAEPFSALTKFFSACVVQSDRVSLPCGQQPCFCCASNNCGQEKQFPQNRAAISATAMIEVKAARIPMFTIPRFQIGFCDGKALAKCGR